jgi:hypothetical protein
MICFKTGVTIFFWICLLLETTYLILFDSKFPKLNRKDITKNLFFNNKKEMHWFYYHFLSFISCILMKPFLKVSSSFFFLLLTVICITVSVCRLDVLQQELRYSWYGFLVLKKEEDYQLVLVHRREGRVKGEQPQKASII